MRDVRRWAAEDDEAGDNRQTASLAGLAVALTLVVAGLFLTNALRHEATVEDCLLAGRITCAASPAP